MTLAVLIPTFRRNASLERALKSVFSQTLTPDRIVVADNSPEGGARDVIAALEAEAPCPLVYVHACQPGVANARNAGFAACANMDRIAQLDDDESAYPGWLAALAAVADATGAAVVFGPVDPEAEGAGIARTAWLRRLYARLPELPDGVTTKPWGCGNSLIDQRAGKLPSPPFDPAANETGGEDDRLFSILARSRARFAWANAARVTEHVDPRRGSWNALARRAFAFGQGPSQDAAERKAWAEVAVWMGIGALQAVLFGLLIAPARLVGPDPCAAAIDKAVQGAGKLFWFDRFAPRFYGAALAKTSR
ncbi:MAG: glycosyltransferase [Alphaproteobacteria bacterium]|nr:glycosyltransferase [Alphaproteobacteria bacterium]